MSQLLIIIGTTALIYLLIAFTLVLIPVKREEPKKSLDFQALNVDSFSKLQTETAQYTTRDKQSLFYRLIKGSSPITIILLHGSGAEGRYLIPLAQNINANLDATVIIPDLRGHGESSLSRMGDIDYVGQFEDDLKDLRNALQTQQPNNSIFLAGHSSGGGLVIRFTGKSPDLFDGYILLAPYLGYKAPTIKQNSGGWVQVLTQRYIGLSMLNNIGITWLNKQKVLFFNRPHNMQGALQAESYTYRLNQSFSPRSYQSDLKAIKQPLLVIVGKDDEAFHASQFQAVFDEYAPHAELHIIPKTKHLDLPSNKTTASLINTWLDKNGIHSKH
jgi:pimeloyl-ACP methyl ester carboxylesterase